MPSLRDAADRLTDERLRLATLVGLVSVPFTVLLSDAVPVEESWYVGGVVAGEPLALAGFAAGWLYHRRPPAARQAGTRVGVVGSLGPALLYVEQGVVTARSASPEWPVLAAVLTLLAVVVIAGVSVLVARVSARVGAWLAGRVRATRPGAAGD